MTALSSSSPGGDHHDALLCGGSPSVFRRARSAFRYPLLGSVTTGDFGIAKLHREGRGHDPQNGQRGPTAVLVLGQQGHQDDEEEQGGAESDERQRDDSGNDQATDTAPPMRITCRVPQARRWRAVPPQACMYCGQSTNG